MFKKLRHTAYIEIILGASGLVFVSVLFVGSFLFVRALVKKLPSVTVRSEEVQSEILQFNVEKTKTVLGTPPS